MEKPCPHCGLKLSVDGKGSYLCPECKGKFKIGRDRKERDDLTVHTIKGFGGELFLYNDKVVIKRKGVISAINLGIQGDKTIFLKSITSIQIKKPGLTTGYIQFVLGGSDESKGGLNKVIHDENSLTFKTKDAYDDACEVKTYIENYALNGNEETELGKSIADELEKLSLLLQKDLITEDEYKKAKSRVISE